MNTEMRDVDESRFQPKKVIVLDEVGYIFLRNQNTNDDFISRIVTFTQFVQFAY